MDYLPTKNGLLVLAGGRFLFAADFKKNLILQYLYLRRSP